MARALLYPDLMSTQYSILVGIALLLAIAGSPAASATELSWDQARLLARIVAETLPHEGDLIWREGELDGYVNLSLSGGCRGLHFYVLPGNGSVAGELAMAVGPDVIFADSSDLRGWNRERPNGPALEWFPEEFRAIRRGIHVLLENTVALVARGQTEYAKALLARVAPLCARLPSTLPSPPFIPVRTSASVTRRLDRPQTNEAASVTHGSHDLHATSGR